MHHTLLVSHGNLKSSNCLVNDRWQVEITGHGLRAFREANTEGSDSFGDMFWTAPELLRMGRQRPLYGTQKGDVYSLGIILQEIVYRALPFFIDVVDMSAEGKNADHSYV